MDSWDSNPSKAAIAFIAGPAVGLAVICLLSICITWNGWWLG